MFFTGILTSTQAQLAIINDPDGFVNVRKGKGANTEIVDKLYENQIFSYDSESIKDLWVKVLFENTCFTDYTTGNIKKVGSAPYAPTEGYIYSNRFIPIENLPHIDKAINHRQVSINKVIIKNDSLLLTLTTKAFIVKEHKITKSGSCSNCDAGIAKIDGRQFYGTDENMPHNELSGISLKIHGQVVDIPPYSYNDLFEPNINSMNVYFDKKGNIYLYMSQNSDGAGSYSAVWLIKNRKLVSRYIDISND